MNEAEVTNIYKFLFSAHFHTKVSISKVIVM